MESIMSLLSGFATAIQPIYLFYAFSGAFLGTIVGVLPGLGPSAAVAILFPVTLSLPAAPAIIMMAGIYYGAQYGGSTTAILINVPGEVSSVTTALDGFQMTRKGRAGAALAMAAIVSFIAGTVATVALTFAGPSVAMLGLKFGPPEYACLIFFSLSAIISLSGKSLSRGIIMCLLGMIIACVGFDTLSSAKRLTFGSVALLNGFEVVAITIGLFAITEIMLSAEEGITSIYKGKIGKLFPNREEWRRGLPAGIRGSIIGFILGLFPGILPSIAAFISYDTEIKISKQPDKFGKGAIEGVAAPEAANNAAATAGFVPLMCLGIPTSPALAMMLAALIINGLKPGPLLFSTYADFTWTVIASMYIGNVMLLVLNLPLVGLWAKMARVPYKILAPMILIFCFIGSYSIRNNIMDLWVCLAFGLIGYALKKKNWPMVPLILGFILGPLMEESVRQSLHITAANAAVAGWTIFFTRPICLGLLVVTIIVTIGSFILKRKAGIRAVMESDEYDG